MRSLYLIACLALLAIASAKITPKVTPNITVYHKDSLQFNLSYVFDLDYASGLTCRSLGGSNAQYIIPNDSIATKDVTSLGFMDNPEISRLVSNNTVFAVYDNSQILIQSLTVDQLRFGETHQKYFGRPGAEAVCSDMVYNKDDGVLYVGCYTKQSDTNPNSTLIIKRLNDTTGDEIKPEFTVMIDDTKQKLTHKLSMHMVTLKAGNVDLRGLVLYDQGFSSGQGNNNKWAWVLSVGSKGTLASYNVVDFPSDFKLTAVYDMFGLRDGIIITGKKSSSLTDKIYMAWCQIHVAGTATFQCHSDLTVAPFGTYYGYLGTFNTGQFVEDQYCGQGKLEFTNGSVYIGEFYADAPHGYGTWINGLNNFIEGQWVRGRANGHVKQHTSKGKSIYIYNLLSYLFYCVIFILHSNWPLTWPIWLSTRMAPERHEESTRLGRA